MSDLTTIAESDAEIRTTIPLEEIHVDEDLQPRQKGLDLEWIDRLLDSEPEDWPPIVVVKIAGRYALVDGQHRLTAAKRLELPEISCHITGEPSDQDLRRLAFALNRAHGKPLTTADMKAEAERLLRRDHEQSDRDIARHCGLSNKSVGVVRSQLEATEEIPQSTSRKGSDGKTRPARPRKSSSGTRSTTKPVQPKS